MNDAELQLAAALQGVPLEQAMLMQKARRAQGLMDAPGAQGASLGRVYRAASPLEHLATALSRGIGARQMKGVEQEWGGLAQRAQAGGLARARAAEAERTEPAPAEWGLPSGLRRSEAVRMLRPPKPADPLLAEKRAKLVAETQKIQSPEAADPMKGPPSDVLRGELKRVGLNPDVYPTTGAALQAMYGNRLPGITYMMGSDENLYALPTKGALTPPRPVPAPGGGTGGFRKDKDLAASERADLSDIAGNLKHVEALERDFKDEYAGMGVTGGVQVGLAQKLGSSGTEGQQGLAEFWSRYERMINIPERHEKFGSALTPQEKASWDAARNIRPGVDPKIARKAFKEIAEITRNVLRRRGDALVAEGYGADAVKASTGGVYGAEPAPKRRRYNPQTGQLE